MGFTRYSLGVGAPRVRSPSLFRRLVGLGYRQPAYQLPSVNVQPARDLDDRFKSQTALPSFNLAELRPVNTAALRGGLLTESKFKSAVADSFAKSAGRDTQGSLRLTIVRHAPTPYAPSASHQSLLYACETGPTVLHPCVLTLIIVPPAIRTG